MIIKSLFFIYSVLFIFLFQEFKLATKISPSPVHPSESCSLLFFRCKNILFRFENSEYSSLVNVKYGQYRRKYQKHLLQTLI